VRAVEERVTTIAAGCLQDKRAPASEATLGLSFPPASGIFTAKWLSMNRVKIFVLLTIIAGALGLIIWQLRPVKPKINPLPAVALGEELATQTLRLINNRGRVVLIETGYKSSPPSTYADLTRTAFRQTLTGQSAVQLVHTETILLDDENPDPMLEGFPAEVFLDLLQRHPDAAAIVSLIGPPRLSPQQMRALPVRRPKLIVVAAYPEAAKPSLAAGVTALAIVPRVNAAPTETLPKTKAEWFNQLYEILPQSAP
jgi:hypothetical protein